MDSAQKPIQIKVEDTNAEAMIAKLSAIKLGYFHDEFAEQFVKPSTVKKDVIIHRGYWLRFHIFQRLVRTYLQSTSSCNIISLGCGYDTLPFHLLKEYPDKDFKFLEIDLPSVIKQKIIKIDKSHKLKQQLTKQAVFDWDKYQLVDERYGIFGADLSNLNMLQQVIQQFNVDYAKPTLIFAECVLTYINSESTTKLLQQLSNSFQNLTFLNYEMFNGNDAFGRMMVRNFETRGCTLSGIDAFPSMQAHQERLASIGFKETEIDDMRNLYIKATESDEKKRIERIEMLDEWEEWNIMQQHYFVSLSHNFTPNNEELQQIKDKVKLIINTTNQEIKLTKIL